MKLAGRRNMQDYVTSLNLHEMAVSFQGRLPDSPPQWKLQANTVTGSASPDFPQKEMLHCVLLSIYLTQKYHATVL
jgi:hypothetical protein